MGASCDACQAAVRRQRHPDHLHPHVQNAGRRSQGAGTARGPMPAMHSQGGRPQIGIDAWNAPRCLTRRPGLVDTVRNAASGMAPFCCPVLRSASNKQHWAATEVARQRRGPDATEIRRLRGRSRASTPRVGHLGTHLTRPPSGHSPPRLGWHPRTFPPPPADLHLPSSTALPPAPVITSITARVTATPVIHHALNPSARCPPLSYPGIGRNFQIRRGHKPRPACT